MVNLKVHNKIIENIELVIFDRDGTLIDLYHYWSNMVKIRSIKICEFYNLEDRHVEKLMFEMGIDRNNSKIKPTGPVGLKTRKEVMSYAIEYLKSLEIDNSEETCNKIFIEADTHSLTLLDSFVKPLDGMYRLIESLVENKCKIAVATTDIEDRAVRTINTLKLSDKFDKIVGSDTVKKGKPNPDMILKISHDLDVDLKKIVMVGDAYTDIEMGKSAKIKASIGVCTGLTTKEDLNEISPFVADSIDNISVII